MRNGELFFIPNSVMFSQFPYYFLKSGGFFMLPVLYFAVGVAFAAGGADLINVVIFLLIIGGGIIAQLIRAAGQKDGAKPDLETKLKESLETRPERQPEQRLPERQPQRLPERQPLRSRDTDVVHAALAQESRSNIQKRRPVQSSLETTSIVSRLSQKSTSLSSVGQADTSLNLVSEIHQMLRDPRSIRQAIILSEILNRKEF